MRITPRMNLSLHLDVFDLQTMLRVLLLLMNQLVNYVDRKIQVLQNIVNANFRIT